MPTTDQDARALTYLAKRLREETHGANRWDEAGISAIVTNLIGRNLPSVVEQVTRHACDPEAKTPGAINRPFLPDAPTDGGRRSYNVPCPNHADQVLPCRLCAARRSDGTQHLALARAELAQARANRCAHGVNRSRAVCRMCDQPTETKETEE